VETQRDAGYLRFRRDSVRIGSTTSVVAATMVAAYAATTWHGGPHRPALLAMAGVVFLAVAVIQITRAERLVETRWCDLFFGVWSTLYVLVIVTLALLDGGAGSPLMITFFPVLVFAGICYPLSWAVSVGVSCVVANVLVGIASPAGYLGGSLYIAGLLVLTAIMCAWQAHTHDLHRQELALASRTDHLTGALNRRGFGERVSAELARAARDAQPLALVLVDLDGFKRVNDARGHAAGDELLVWVSSRLRAGLRPSDAAGRLGGDEFALLLPGIDSGEAHAVAERLRTVLAERTSASFGVGVYPDAGDEDEIAALADAELYRDKRRAQTAELLAPDLGLGSSLIS
jgi:diguanylate cyclase (GGDEF)-like protein